MTFALSITVGAGSSSRSQLRAASNGTSCHMRFTLYYRGLLKSNRGARDKQILRRHFHAQLRELWTHKPLSGFRAKPLDKSREDQTTNIVRRIGDFEFAPLVCERVSLVAELSVTLFRPQAPGALVGSGGDVDNRLKTLLDALKVPSEPNALPQNDSPRPDEAPFHCLLEDDKLVTRLAVTTERLLEPGLDPNEVLLLVGVKTRVVETIWGNLGLG